ncbi:MAG: V-type ATP synthase subunit D, partial [Eubacterium aggregans]
MALKITPTKANLIKSKARLSFSTKGYNLLDKKRTVLIQEIMKLVQQSEEIETQIGATFKEAYIVLQQVTISMGLNHLDEFALSIPPETPFDTRTRSVMGVDIPELVIPESAKESLNLPYGFYENNPALDVAIAKFNEMKE